MAVFEKYKDIKIVNYTCKYEQSYFNSENFAYSKLPFLKIQVIKPAVSFQKFLHRSPE